MSYRDLESWEYHEDGFTAWYISSSRTIVIMKYPAEDATIWWFWRVYDDGVPEMGGEELFYDSNWNHDIGFFSSAYEAYQDVCAKGMERSS